MIRLSLPTLNALTQRLDEAQKLYNTAEDKSTIPAELYCQYLPETSDAQGQMMAAHVMQIIKQFKKQQQEFASTPLEEMRARIRDEIAASLNNRPLKEQCDLLFQLCEGISHATGSGAAPAAGERYSGFVTETARDELLQRLTDSIFTAPVSNDFSACPLTIQTRTRLREMDDDLCRAVYVMAIHTLLLDLDCCEDFNRAPASLDFTVRTVCALTLETAQEPEAQLRLNWSVLLWSLSAAMAAGKAVIIHRVRPELIAIACALTLSAVLSVFCYVQELETRSENVSIPLQLLVTDEEETRIWTRISSRLPQKTNDDDDPGDVPVFVDVPTTE